MSVSEVAQLMQQLELEAQAMNLALYGYAEGARHEIINRKYASFGAYQEQLATHVGTQEAARIAAEIYIKEVK